MTGQANLEAGIKHKVAAGTGHIESSPAMDGCGVSSEQASHEQQQSVMTENNSNPRSVFDAKAFPASIHFAFRAKV